MNSTLRQFIRDSLDKMPREKQMAANDLIDVALILESRELVKLLLDVLNAKDMWLQNEQSKVSAKLFQIKSSKHELNRFLDGQEGA